MDLFELQYRIHQHNVRYNPVVAIMSQQEKVKHFGIRLGRMAAELPSDDVFETDDAASELLLVVMTLASYLNINLVQRVRQASAIPIVRPVSGPLDSYAQATIPRGLFDIKLHYLDLAGRFAKVAEALDHLEPLEFRKTVEELVPELFVVALQIYKFEDQQHQASRVFEQYILQREAKNVFSDFYGHFTLAAASEYKPL